ncbi:hypothetical protein SAY87_026202 [Trapa incisa]|uniref:Uncharacterized protein n=1 Tax=Trapa incisa TaxID=236973 RepID=A0AAN7GTW7_9MYRT|nr:hypothetical protein SAY87_026202 [Trapa incisa]
MNSGVSNLQRFLDSVTPIVPSTTLHQSHFHEINLPWHPPSTETVKYFKLKDLWDSYKEWSAFGACTRVVFSSGEAVKKYFVPHLSAIQIYTNKSLLPSSVKSEVSSNSTVEFESDAWSDDSGSDKLSGSPSNSSSKAWDNMSDDSNLDPAVSLHARERFGHIYLEFFESCSPNWRVPMMDKINELAKDRPALMTLRSMDLSPASWMAIAWYPIYHIPNVGSKGLSTCFLTYHTLSSAFLDNGKELELDDETETLKGTCPVDRADEEISLSPFGLATYKMQGDLWVNPLVTPEYLKFINLQNAAHSWLKQLNVNHPDLSFFTHHHSAS